MPQTFQVRTCILTRSQVVQIHTKGQEAMVEDTPSLGCYTQLGGKHNKYTLLRGPTPAPIKQAVLTSGNIGCSSKKLQLEVWKKDWIYFWFLFFRVRAGNLLNISTSSPWKLWVTPNKGRSEWPAAGVSWLIKWRGCASFLYIQTPKITKETCPRPAMYHLQKWLSNNQVDSFIFEQHPICPFLR